jgi:glucosamine-6-phosphate deaminase
MEVVITNTRDEAGKLAADAIGELVQRRPEAVLGVATGSSPLIIYDELGRRVAQGSLSLASARAFMLDEYVGLAADHPQRYRNVIQAEFVDKVDIDPAQVLGPDGVAEDLAKACDAYEQR